MQKDSRFGLPLYRAIRKYGEKNLNWEIIDTAKTQQELDEKEKYWIKYYQSFIKYRGYNITQGGNGVSGLKLSDESRSKIRDAELGDKNSNSKLSNDDVLKIVELSKSYNLSGIKLSRMFCTSEANISRILSGLRWSSITGITYKNTKLICE